MLRPTIAWIDFLYICEVKILAHPKSGEGTCLLFVEQRVDQPEQESCQHTCRSYRQQPGKVFAEWDDPQGIFQIKLDNPLAMKTLLAEEPIPSGPEPAASCALPKDVLEKQGIRHARDLGWPHVRIWRAIYLRMNKLVFRFFCVSGWVAFRLFCFCGFYVGLCGVCGFSFRIFCIHNSSLLGFCFSHPLHYQFLSGRWLSGIACGGFLALAFPIL